MWENRRPSQTVVVVTAGIVISPETGTIEQQPGSSWKSRLKDSIPGFNANAASKEVA